MVSLGCSSLHSSYHLCNGFLLWDSLVGSHECGFCFSGWPKYICPFDIFIRVLSHLEGKEDFHREAVTLNWGTCLCSSTWLDLCHCFSAPYLPYLFPPPVTPTPTPYPLSSSSEQITSVFWSHGPQKHDDSIFTFLNFYIMFFTRISQLVCNRKATGYSRQNLNLCDFAWIT